jgi:hypothetical protein
MLFWLADAGGAALFVGIIVMVAWYEKLNRPDPLEVKYEHAHDESGCVRVLYPPLRAVQQAPRLFDYERDA